MFRPEPKQEDWEVERLLSNYTQDDQDTETVQLPVGRSCSRLGRLKRVVMLGLLLTSGVALLTTTFVSPRRYFRSSFERFGPAEPHGSITPVSSWFWLRRPAAGPVGGLTLPSSVEQ